MSEVAVRPAGALAIDSGQTFWTEEQRAALRQLGVDEASNGDLAVFLNQAQRTGLDPFSRQLYMIGRWDSRAQAKKWTIQASIDGLRIIAQRSGDYAGQVGPEWCGPDSVWHDVWLQTEAPAAARVGVLRTGFAAPLYAVAMFREYVGTDRDGKPTAMWRDKAALMIAKCAEALALRKAFPNDMSGIYTSEEMSRADIPTAAPGTHLVEGVVVDQVPADAPEWADAIAAAATVEEIRQVWNRYAANLETPGRARLSEAMTVRKAEIEADPAPATDDDGVVDADIVEDDDADEPATRSDLTRVSIRLGELGIRDRQDCVDYCGARIGRVIQSRTQLTRVEAHRVIAALDAEIAAEKNKAVSA